MRKSFACAQSYSRWSYHASEWLVNDVHATKTAKRLPFLCSDRRCRSLSSSSQQNEDASTISHDYFTLDIDYDRLRCSQKGASTVHGKHSGIRTALLRHRGQDQVTKKSLAGASVPRPCAFSQYVVKRRHEKEASRENDPASRIQKFVSVPTTTSRRRLIRRLKYTPNIEPARQALIRRVLKDFDPTPGREDAPPVREVSVDFDATSAKSNPATSSNELAGYDKQYPGFDPYSGPRRLKGLAAKLGDMSNSLAMELTRNDLDVESPDAAFEGITSPLPISPLEKVMDRRHMVTYRDDEAGHLRLMPKPGRRPATKEETAAFANNIWAQLLASPIRLDVASRHQFPVSMMVNFKQIKESDKLFTVPADIADLQSFQRNASIGAKSKAIPKMRNEDRTITNRILPYKLGIEEMTTALTVYDTRSKTRRTKERAMRGRLQFLRAETRLQKIAVYDNASKEYWKLKEESKELDDACFKKPEAQSSPYDAEWLPDIADRLGDIMRQRLLIAVNEFANVHNSLLADRKSFICMEWPAASIIDLSLFAASKGPDLVEHWNDMGDIEAPNAVSGDNLGQGNNSDPRPPIAVKPSEISIEQPVTGRTPSDPQVWLPGSFAMHIGSPSTALQAVPFSQPLLPASSYQRANEFPLEYNKFIPPMLTIDDVRVPVFNLQAMLGRTLSDMLYRVLARQPTLLPDDFQNQAINSLDYIVLVKSNAKASFYLSHELWQLWRYLGGRDCLFTAATQDASIIQKGELKTKDDPHKEQAEYQGLSVAAFKHLHELLGLDSKSS